MINGWMLDYDHYDPANEQLREALCTLGNGYVCTRGAAPEAQAGEQHYPGTYLAGGYNRLETHIAGRVIENEDLVNMPNWLPLSFRIEDDPWFDLDKVTILSYSQKLDLRQGLLLRRVRFRDRHDRVTRFTQRRLVHMGNRHLAALESELIAENWSGSVTFRSALDGSVVNANVARYQDLANRHLEPLKTRQVDKETIFLQCRTNQSHLEVALAARSRIWVEARDVDVERTLKCRDDHVAQEFRMDVERDSAVRIEKIVAFFTSRDEAISECGLDACNELAAAEDFAALLERHVLHWQYLWRDFDIELVAAEEEQGDHYRAILRLHIFHLLQTASMHTIKLDVGIPPRGWHGEAYRGHIFWDELFIFPLLNLRAPEITRTLLLYRYYRLPQARCAAVDAGFRGAMFPWQSGSNGREESQQVHLNPKSGNWIPDRSRLQRHVNAAIAWNVWHYFQATADIEFLSCYGAEMILEIARFWASMARWNAELERYEIIGVMGPDEYHDAYPGAEQPGLDNNSYTNVMAVWTLTCALDVLKALSEERREELCETLALDSDETALWDRISRSMRLVFHDDGILSQFEGYEDLAELDWNSYRKQYGKVMRLDRILEAEQDTPNRYKCSKQADVLMLFYLFSSDELCDLFERLGYPFTHDTIPDNIDYYLQRTSHGSTLSQIVHSWVLSRSDREGSWQLFREALHADIDDIQGGTTPEGIHLGAMAGTVDLLQRGYTGIETRGDVLHLNPCLPRELDTLKLRLRYRGLGMDLKITTEHMTVTCLQCGVNPIKLQYRDDPEVIIEGGKSRQWELKS